MRKKNIFCNKIIAHSNKKDFQLISSFFLSSLSCNIFFCYEALGFGLYMYYLLLGNNPSLKNKHKIYVLQLPLWLWLCATWAMLLVFPLLPRLGEVNSGDLGFFPANRAPSPFAFHPPQTHLDMTSSVRKNVKPQYKKNHYLLFTAAGRKPLGRQAREELVLSHLCLARLRPISSLGQRSQRCPEQRGTGHVQHRNPNVCLHRARLSRMPHVRDSDGLPDLFGLGVGPGK